MGGEDGGLGGGGGEGEKDFCWIVKNQPMGGWYWWKLVDILRGGLMVN